MSDLTPEERLQQCYRNVFSSPEGRRVLGDILTMGHFTANIDPNDSVLVAQKNFAETIARMAGAFDTFYPQWGMVDGKSGSD